MQISRVKLECEERLKGMIPRALKSDLEETIDSLRSQVSREKLISSNKLELSGARGQTACNESMPAEVSFFHPFTLILAKDLSKH